MTGKQLEKIRKDFTFNRTEFGELLGYSSYHIWRMETGRRRVSRRAILELEKHNLLKKK